MTNLMKTCRASGVNTRAAGDLNKGSLGPRPDLDGMGSPAAAVVGGVRCASRKPAGEALIVERAAE